MEKDIATIFKCLEKKQILIEEYFNLKLPYSLYLYFKFRRFLILLLMGIIICFLCLAILSFILVLFVFFLEFLNVYPLHKSVELMNKEFEKAAFFMFRINTDDKCLIGNVLKEFIRNPAKCGFCKTFNKIKRISNLSQIDFLGKYAYTGHPVIVNDAANDWSARKIFSFSFFQKIYAYSLISNISSDYIFNRKTLTNEEKIWIMKNNQKKLNCQFFKYKTDFQSLEDFLSINISDIKNSVPWYIGWSNCDPIVGRILRTHYKIPYFLPETSESHNSDWIFMGYPGYGAKMHIDFVHRPSWQAQLKGRKLWKLKPPHECRLVCQREIEAVVEPGDIIVLDTNLWYHQTKIIGDEISITIGAEYD